MDFHTIIIHPYATRGVKELSEPLAHSPNTRDCAYESAVTVASAKATFGHISGKQHISSCQLSDIHLSLIKAEVVVFKGVRYAVREHVCLSKKFTEK